MSILAFWNNKGGTGKTSLAFQVISTFAQRNPSKRILAIDMCPQSNLSELLLGGLLGKGGDSLLELYGKEKRQTIGGYFQDRLPAPFTFPKGEINFKDYVTKPNTYNKFMPQNIDLIAGDSLLELQANAISTLANTSIPATNTWIAVIDWLKDLINVIDPAYDCIFIDTNPSFSIYTQIALSCAHGLILPIMADDSSRRAIHNVFSLIYGIQMPASKTYEQYSFSKKLTDEGRRLPKVQLIIKNRITQYMGSASAYKSVLSKIDEDIKTTQSKNADIFNFKDLADGLFEVRDFQTTGVVAFAEGNSFSTLNSGYHYIDERKTRVHSENIQLCLDDILPIVSKISENL